MALIKYGGGIIQMSGSVAGNTHARNRFGNYMRARTKPTNPNTANQQAVRAAMSELTTRWAQVLTADQRTAWNLYGSNVAMKNRLGEVVKLTGFNHYIRSNLTQARIPGNVVDDGPVIFELPEKDPSFAITASETTQEITFTFDDTMEWCDEDNSSFEIYQGVPQNAQRNFFDGPWRFQRRYMGNSVTPPESPLAWTVMFAIAEGQHQWCCARITRADGRLSEIFRADCFCAA